jgi:hypothetical protein
MSIGAEEIKASLVSTVDKAGAKRQKLSRGSEKACGSADVREVIAIVPVQSVGFTCESRYHSVE